MALMYPLTDRSRYANVDPVGCGVVDQELMEYLCAAADRIPAGCRIAMSGRDRDRPTIDLLDK